MDTTTKVVMLGTGTPNANPDRSGPAVAILHEDNSYIVDFGPGVVRQASKAYRKYGFNQLKPKNLCISFLTHLHSDHAAGLADLLLSPWVLGRSTPLKIYGPKGLKDMAYHISKAYQVDIDGRLNGFEPANPDGYKVDVSEITDGTIYELEGLKIKAFSVNHPPYESYGYKFIADDKTIVVSGDTAPCEALLREAYGCDILVHEVYSHEGLSFRNKSWQQYHRSVHTSSIELGRIAQQCGVKKLVLYHQLFMLNLQNVGESLDEILTERENKMVEDIRINYTGIIISAKDMDVID